MVTFQFVPYHEIEDLGSARRVKKLIDIVKQNKIVLLEGRLKKEENQVSGILNSFKKDNFEEKHALLAGDIQIKLKERGDLVDFRDLFIASICIENKLELLTNNKKHFERLEQFGLKLLTT